MAKEIHRFKTMRDRLEDVDPQTRDALRKEGHRLYEGLKKYVKSQVHPGGCDFRDGEHYIVGTSRPGTPRGQCFVKFVFVKKLRLLGLLDFGDLHQRTTELLDQRIRQALRELGN